MYVSKNLPITNFEYSKSKVKKNTKVLPELSTIIHQNAFQISIIPLSYLNDGEISGRRTHTPNSSSFETQIDL